MDFAELTRETREELRSDGGLTGTP